MSSMKKQLHLSLELIVTKMRGGLPLILVTIGSTLFAEVYSIKKGEVKFQRCMSGGCMDLWFCFELFPIEIKH